MHSRLLTPTNGLVGLVVLLPVAFVLSVVSMGGSARAAVGDELPDLVQGPPTNISFDTATIPGRRLLRYRSQVMNVGTGAFEIHGSRKSTEPTMSTVVQRIYQTAGGFRDVPTVAQMLYETADGHNHWHTQDLIAGQLDNLSNGAKKVAVSAKHGFCFLDSQPSDLTLSGAPSSPVYGGCGGQNSTAVTTGISVGWADVYSANFIYQWIDITDLGSGNYRLVETADPSNWFAEVDETNNSTTVDIHIPPATSNPPSVTLDNPVNGSTTTAATPTFSGSASNSSTASPTVTVNVYGGSSSSGTPLRTLSTTRAGDGSYAVTSATPLPDGTYTAQAEQQTVYASDGFSRTVPGSTSWGTADRGGGWSSFFSTTGTAYRVDGNAAQITRTASGTFAQVLSSFTKSSADVDSSVRVAWDRAATSTADLAPLILLTRFANGQNYYQGKLSQTAGGALDLSIAKTIGGSQTTIAGPIRVAASYTLNSFWRVRFAAIGAGLRIRAWPDGTSEPQSWGLTATDTSLTGSGGVGIRTSGTAVGTVISYDDFIAAGGTGYSSANTFTVAAGGEPPPTTPPVDITTTSLPDGANKKAYSATLTATGGTTPYSWSIVSGTLPPGVSLASSTGRLSGKCNKVGVYSFTVGVSDTSSPIGRTSKALSIRVVR